MGKLYIAYPHVEVPKIGTERISAKFSIEGWHRDYYA
jgi:hypothetical protein